MSRATAERVGGPIRAVSDRLAWLREGPRADLVMLVAFLLAAALGFIHWIGLLAGGVLVGLVAPSLRRALVLALYLAGVWVLGFVGWLWLAGVLDRAVATGELFGLSVGMAVVLPVLGASIRGLG